MVGIWTWRRSLISTGLLSRSVFKRGRSDFVSEVLMFRGEIKIKAGFTKWSPLPSYHRLFFFLGNVAFREGQLYSMCHFSSGLRKVLEESRFECWEPFVHALFFECWKIPFWILWNLKVLERPMILASHQPIRVTVNA